MQILTLNAFRSSLPFGVGVGIGIGIEKLIFDYDNESDSELSAGKGICRTTAFEAVA